MSVREIENNKVYQIEVVIGYNGNKKIRHYETFYGGKKDTLLHESEIKMRVKNNTFVRKNSLTIKDLTEEWLKQKENTIAIKTYKSYCILCNNIVKAIGHIKIKDINVKILEDFYKEVRENTDVSDSTMQRYYILINMMLNKAIDWDYLSFNPNTKIEKPKARKKEVSCYTPEEVEQLLKVLKNECLKYQAIILLALDSGARRGEITGLTWEDINFNEGTININKSTQYVPGYGVFEKETKTATSDRKIYISQTILDILKQYKKEQTENRLLLGNKWQNSKRVFTTKYGGDMHPDTPSKIFEKIIKKYNLRHINFHALRHTSISLMISKGIQTQVISKKARTF